MPLTIPAFDQYQAPMPPLRGLWNAAPKEGDRYVNAEIDWLVTTKSNAVQFSLSGNSPVSLSQIVAMWVDNGRCGSDLDLIFPDSGAQLTIPAHCQGLFPVFTNALMFYASAPAAVAGDTTILQIMNSMPPPVPVPPTEAQNHQGATGVTIANGSTQIVPAGVSGALNTISINLALATAAAAGVGVFALQDGTGKTVWIVQVNQAANLVQDYTYNVPGLNVRFVNGLTFVQSAVSGLTGTATVNVYYTSP